MPKHTVTEVYAPRQTGRDAIGAIGHAGEETADSADADAQRERQDEQVAGRDNDTEPALDPLYCHEPADESADDGLAADQHVWVDPVRTELDGILDQARGGCQQGRRRLPPRVPTSDSVHPPHHRAADDRDGTNKRPGYRRVFQKPSEGEA